MYKKKVHRTMFKLRTSKNIQEHSVCCSIPVSQFTIRRPNVENAKKADASYSYNTDL